MNEAMEGQIAAARNASMQDKKVPLLININDYRLMPNVPMIRNEPNYRPYHGDPYATLAERQRYLEGTALREVVLDVEPFNIGKASKEELIAFAIDQYGVTLDGRKTRENLAQEVVKLAEANGVLNPNAGQ